MVRVSYVTVCARAERQDITMTIWEVLIIWVALAAGNFVYAALYGTWEQAFERSFFQLGAVLTVYAWYRLK